MIIYLGNQEAYLTDLLELMRSAGWTSASTVIFSFPLSHPFLCPIESFFLYYLLFFKKSLPSPHIPLQFVPHIFYAPLTINLLEGADIISEVNLPLCTYKTGFPLPYITDAALLRIPVTSLLLNPVVTLLSLTLRVALKAIEFFKNFF